MRSLLVLVLLAASAHARPAPRPILPDASCYLEPAVYPAPKSRDVPLDARAWIVGSDVREFDIPYRLRWDKSERLATVTKHAPFNILELNLGKLLPNKRYTLLEGNNVISTFTTGRTAHSRMPRAPEINRALAMHDLPQTSFFEMYWRPDAARRFVELRIDDRVVFAPAGEGLRLGMSCANVYVDARFCFEATAIDLAGARSTPTSYCGTVEQGPGLEPYSDSRYRENDQGMTPLPNEGPPYPWRPAFGFALAFSIGGLVIWRARCRRTARHLA